MKARIGTCAAAILALSATAAMAQQPPGFYVGGFGGLNWLRDADVTGPGINSGTEYDRGWGLLGALGYIAGNLFPLNSLFKKN